MGATSLHHYRISNVTHINVAFFPTDRFIRYQFLFNTHTGLVLKSLTSKHRTSNRKSARKDNGYIAFKMHSFLLFQSHELHCKKCGVTDHRIREDIKFGSHIYLLIDLQPQTQSCSHLDCTSLPIPEINKENNLLLEHIKQT
jgi:hypothetical protein